MSLSLDRKVTFNIKKRLHEMGKGVTLRAPRWPEDVVSRHVGASRMTHLTHWLYMRSSGSKPRTRKTLFIVCAVACTSRARNALIVASVSLTIGGVCS